MRFQALELSIELIHELRDVVEQLRRRDPDLERQLRRAASGVPLSVAEGRRRVGKDRVYHFRVAAGSADEAHAALRVAVAWGYLDKSSTREALAKLDELLKVLWGLTR